MCLDLNRRPRYEVYHLDFPSLSLAELSRLGFVEACGGGGVGRLASTIHEACGQQTTTVVKIDHLWTTHPLSYSLLGRHLFSPLILARSIRGSTLLLYYTM